MIMLDYGPFSLWCNIINSPAPAFEREENFFSLRLFVSIVSR